jgi:hypothetical protein
MTPNRSVEATCNSRLTSDARRLILVDLVDFIRMDTGDDLILSFAVQDPNDPMEIESLILLRTPKFEFIFDEHERGIRASFERFSDEDDYLEEARFSEQERTIQLKTRAHTHNLDLRKLDRKELNAMRKLLRKMNYDSCVKLSGV